MVFYDFEVTKYDWLAVLIELTRNTEHETVLHNDKDSLQKFYDAHSFDIWTGYNSRHYDQYILKTILSGLDPKSMNDWIIVQNKEPWQFSSLLRDISLNNYDVMPNPPIGLKTLEGFMGSDIKETEVPFDIDRPLTDEELEQMIFYCRHDVEETIKVFFEKKAEFDAQFGIVQAFNLPLSCIGDTEARIVSKVLDCKKIDHGDEFDYFFLPCIELNKYAYVMEWFRNAVKDCKKEMVADGWDPNDDYTFRYRFYKRSLPNQIIADVPHTFGWGGLHGAPDKPIHAVGYILHVDVGSYYPSMLIAWDLVTRAAQNDNYKKVYDTRMELKRAGKKKEQAPYKKLLNALSGAMKDRTNPAFDARNNNTMCVNGQLMLLDLIEHLEAVPGFQLIQSNTDGLIIAIPDTDEAFNMVDDICYDWETRCSTDKCKILLSLDLISEIYQKDVNNYLWIEEDGSIEKKGAYVKNLSPTDFDLPILNKALCDYMVHKIPVEKTINECDDLIMFQKIAKLSDKYEWVEREYGDMHYEDKFTKTGKKSGKILVYAGSDKYTYKSYRVFASSDPKAGRLLKCKRQISGSPKKDKFGNTPEHCFIWNDVVEGVKCPKELDRQWYIDFAIKRLNDYGIDYRKEVRKA